MWTLRTPLITVMAGLVPAIHALTAKPPKDADGRDKPGHDEHRAVPSDKELLSGFSQKGNGCRPAPLASLSVAEGLFRRHIGDDAGLVAGVAGRDQFVESAQL